MAKKIKKEKVDKKELKTSRGLRPWMTILGVVGGVSLVCGATVLGVFLTGGFEEKVVSPEDISFVYDESLFNDAYSQLEISDSSQEGEFELVINTTTEEVTQKKVELSFDDALEENVVTSIHGFVSNSIIQVPQFVNIGEPFTVKLLNEMIEVEEENGEGEIVSKKIDWIKGGISTLFAQSENIDVPVTSLKIAVDTPVYSTRTVVYDSTGKQIQVDEEGIKVIAGEAFTVDTKFFPAKSEYMYADDSAVNAIDEDARRKKHSFFEAKLATDQPNAIVPEYDGKYKLHFVAANKTFEKPIAINAYTFRYADVELEFTNNHPTKSTPEDVAGITELEFYQLAITTLASDMLGAYKQEGEIIISEATIGQFRINNQSNVMLTRGKSTRLYLDFNEDDPALNYLSASVRANTVEPRYLDNMLKQIGIRFTNSAGKDVAIASDDQLISLSDCQEVKYDLNGDGVLETFYLPNASGANVRKGYWNITALPTDSKETQDDENITMEIVLFTSITQVEGEGGTYYQGKIYQQFATGNDGEEIKNDVVISGKSLVLTDKQDYNVSWNDASSLTINLDYQNSKFIPQTINLSKFITVPKDKDVVFFVDFKDVTADAEGGINRVLGETSYSDLVEYLEPNGVPVKLYVLTEQTITLYDTGSFDIYFATINSKAEPGQLGYIELWCNDAKQVVCQKSLYQESVSGAVIMLPEAAFDSEQYYTYVGVENELKTVFTVDFIVNPDSYPAFQQAIENGEQFDIKLYDSLGNDISHYFTLHTDLAAGITTNPSLIDLAAALEEGEVLEGDYRYAYRAIYKIKDNITINSDLVIDKGEGEQTYTKTALVARAELLFGKKDEEAAIVWGNKGEATFGFSKYLYIYKPVTASIVIADEYGGATGGIVTEDVINVNQTLLAAGGLSTSITYTCYMLDGDGTYTEENATLEEFIEDLTYGIVLTDQHGDTQSLQGKWQFVTNNSDIISISDDKQSFEFKNASNEKANIWIEAQDSISNEPAIKNEAGNTKIYTLNLTTTGVGEISVDGGARTNVVTSAEITRKGSIDTSQIEIPSIIKYYIVNNGVESVYNPTEISYALSAITTTSMTDEQKKDLFGYYKESEDAVEPIEGWLEIQDQNEQVVRAIIDYDGNVVGFTGDITNLKTITIKKNFSAPATIVINISAIGINTTLTINISAENSIEGATEYSVFAGKAYASDVISNTIVLSEASLLGSYTGTHYVVASEQGGYRLDSAEENALSAVGHLDNGVLTFNDFWTEEEKTFTIRFAPEGDGYYAVWKDITFTVQRNIKIVASSDNLAGNLIPVEAAAEMTYFIVYSGGKPTVSTFVSVTRIEGDDKTLPEIAYATTALTNSYFTINKAGEIERNANIEIIFGTETIVQGEQSRISISIGSTILATVQLQIKLHDDIYSNVASSISKKISVDQGQGAAQVEETVNAKVQEINGKKYVVVDATKGSTSWEWNGSITGGTIALLGQHKGYRSELYEIQAAQTEQGPGDISFNTKGVLYGYNSNNYLIIHTEGSTQSNKHSEWIYIPAIISAVGETPVLYNKKGDSIASQDGRNGAISKYSERYLDVAMMSPDDLIANGIYDEFIAGESYTIYNAKGTDGHGLWFGNGMSISIDVYDGAGATNSEITNKIRKQINYVNTTGEKTVKIDLYDLADNIGGDYYIALKYTVILSSTGHRQDFYYLMKIIPNVHVEDPVYPYGENTRYENLQESNGQIDLNATFDSTTLATGQNRFNVSYILSYDQAKTFTIKKINKDSIIRFTWKDQTKEYIATENKDNEDNEVLTLTLKDYFPDIQKDDKLYMILQNSEIEVTYAETENAKVYTPSAYIDTVSNVTVNDNYVYTDKAEWSSFISIEIVNGVMTYQAHISDPISFTIKRTYVNSQDTSIEQIVSGSHEYVFMVNDRTKDYSIRFIKQVDDPATSEVVEAVTTTLPDTFGVTQYTISFRNGDVDDSAQQKVQIGLVENGTEDGYTYTGLKLFLIENAVAGNSSSGTEVFNVVHVECSNIEGDVAAFKGKTISVFDPADESGAFTLNLPKYISQDTKLTFTIFTTYGHIATLIFDLKANASVTFVGEKSSWKAGNSYLWGSQDGSSGIFDLQVTGDAKKFASIQLDCDVIDLNEESKAKYAEMKKYISIDSGNNIVIKDTTKTQTFKDVPFIITFTDGDIYKFVTDFTIEANVIKTAAAYENEKEVVAGNDLVVEVAKLFDEGGAPTSGFSVTAESAQDVLASGNVAVTGDDDKYSITIKTIHVASKVTATIQLTFMLNSGEEVVVSYIVTIAPSVKLETTYPNPTGEGSIGKEFVKHEFTTDNINVFLNGTALFADNTRIVELLADAPTADGETEVTYSDKGTISIMTVTLAKASNANIYIVGDETDSVKENVNITGKAIRFERGTNAAEDSIIVLSVKLNNVVATYTIYISDELWTTEGNYVTNNVTTEYYPKEKIYGTHRVTATESYDISILDIVDAEKLKNGSILKCTLSLPDGASGSTEGFKVQYNNKSILNKEFKYDSDNNIISVSDVAVDTIITIENTPGQTTTEKIYIDKTEITDIFADDRMASVSVSSTAEAGEYYVVYLKNGTDSRKKSWTGMNKIQEPLNIPEYARLSQNEEIIIKVTGNAAVIGYDGEYIVNNFDEEAQMVTTSKTGVLTFNSTGTISIIRKGNVTIEYIAKSYGEYYASYPLYIKADDIGKNLTVDLGKSMSGCRYYATYSTEEIEKAKISLATDRLLKVKDAAGQPTDMSLDDLDNMTQANIFVGEPVATNRIQLYYGSSSEKYAVASHKYEPDNDNVGNISNVGTIEEVAGILVDFKLTGADETLLSFKYHYKPMIDIDMKDSVEASDAANFDVVLEAGKEYTSLSQELGLVHPSTGLHLSPVDGDMVSLALTVVDDATATTLEFYDSYKGKCGPTETPFFKSTTDDGQEYLSYSQVTNSSGKTYDFYLLPHGAKNDGDFVLLKLEYTVGAFTKTFYAVVKIVPAYTVSFGDASNQGETENGVLTNIDSPYIISTASDGTYEKFTLVAQDASANPYLSIRHTYGGGAELAAANFTIKMPINDGKYNISTNIASKLGELSSKAELSEDEKYHLFNKPDGETADITFENAQEAVFGDQYYYIEGTDSFGFVYRLYFTLASTGNIPTANNQIAIVEEGYFDIGLQYQLLSLTQQTTGEYLISAETVTPTKNSTFELINISGIDAWLFKADDNVTIVDAENGEVTIGDPAQKITVAQSSKDYLQKPAFIDVSIDSIQITDASGKEIGVAAVSPPEQTSTFMTSDEINWGDYTGRGQNTDYCWQMPRLPGDIFGSSASAQVRLLITFVYKKDDTTAAEIYTCPVTATVYREVQITGVEGTNNVVDGTLFNVANQFVVTSNGDGIAPTFYNDTLEILASPSGTPSFTMTLKDSEGATIKEDVSVSLPRNNSTESTTQYISLSQYFGVNVVDGYTVEISAEDDINAFYYMTGDASADSEVVDSFTIAAITKDCIYLEKASLLAGGNASVTKYYIASCTIDKTAFNYQVSRTYSVRGVYSGFSQGYTGFVGNTIIQPNGETIEIPFANWAGGAFTFNGSSVSEPTNLRFEIVEEAGAVIGIASFKKDANNNPTSTLVLTKTLAANEYIKVRVLMAVSGEDRNISTISDENTIWLEVGQLRLGPTAAVTSSSN